MKETVLITGSSSGFGRLITETLIKEGHTVFATMIGLETFSAQAVVELRALAEQNPGTVHVIELDVTDDTSVEQAVAEALALESRIDVVINNAGIGSTGWTEAFPPAQFEKMLAVNVVGVQRVMRAVLPHMRVHKAGLIINISSIQGRVVFPYSGAYTATKFAVEGLSESYRYELRPLGIDVCVVQPGGFRTAFEAVQRGPADEERTASYGELAEAPYQVWGQPGEDKDFLPHPQPVPDAILALIRQPNGQRHLRTTVDPLLGGEEPGMINEAAERAQAQLAEKLGWW